MRKLATIQKISDISPIAGADKIEVASVKGWKVIVEKGEFQKYDLGVYFEIDSFLPLDSKYEFLRKSSFKRMADGSEGFRLRTIRLRNQVSQGLLMPLSIFNFGYTPDIEEDVSDLLNIRKYEPPLAPNLQGEARGTLPAFLERSDQERIQNLPDYFSLYRNMEFESTEKLDGTSCTIYWYDGDFGVCGHNIEWKETESNIYWKMARLLNLEAKLSNYQRNIAIQAEIVGEGIQKNHYKFLGQRFFIYDVYNIDKSEYFIPAERLDILHELTLLENHVPIIKTSEKIFSKCTDFNNLFKHSDGKSKLADVTREGLVFKSLENRISFKVISNEYLLKEEK